MTTSSNLPYWRRRDAISFAEPELKMQLIACDAGFTIRVVLVGPAAPAWAPQGEYHVDLLVSAADLQAAAEAWRHQLDSYPCR